MAQFVAVRDVYTWKLLRRDVGLSRRQTVWGSITGSGLDGLAGTGIIPA
jgi:hypothetical protein